MPAKPYPEVPQLKVFSTPPGMMTQPPPWTPYSIPGMENNMLYTTRKKQQKNQSLFFV